MTVRPAAVAMLAAMLAGGGLAARAERQTPASPTSATPDAPDAGVPATIQFDAIVTDRDGHVIRGLTPADFALRDTGQPVRLERVTRASSDGDGRLLGLFLDEYHIQPGDETERARAAAKAVIDALAPNDAVAIMRPLDPLPGITITTDHARLRAVVDAMAGRKGNYTPRTPFEETFMSRAPATAEASRAQVVTAGLRALAERLGAAREGRKSLVWISEGFGARGNARDSPADRPHERQHDTAPTQLTGGLRAVAYAATRAGVAVYALDPAARAVSDGPDAPAATSGPPPPSLALRALADITGGRVALDQTELETIPAAAVRDLDDYYTLAYRAATRGDGTYHRLELRVTRAGAVVRAPAGYWAAVPAPIVSAAAAGARPAMISLRPVRSSPLIRPWIGTMRGPDGLTTVTVAWEAGQPPPRNQQVQTVLLTATALDGQVLFHDRLTGSATFNAPPGLVQLEMSIQGQDGKALDADYRTLEVPNLAGTSLTFATIQVVRTRNAREFALAAANPAAVPAATREFSRAERLLIRVPIYGPGGGDSSPAATVTATLLNRDGTPMRTIDAAPGAPLPGLMQFDLLLSFLAPDEYRVRFTARDQGQEIESLLLFRVVN